MPRGGEARVCTLSIQYCTVRGSMRNGCRNSKQASNEAMLSGLR